MRDWEEALEINPSSANALNNLCAANVDLMKYIEALALCNVAIKIDPEMRMAWSNRARANYWLSNYKEYVDDSSMSISLSKQPSPNVFAVKAFCHEYLEDLPAAIRDYAVAAYLTQKIQTFQITSLEIFSTVVLR